MIFINLERALIQFLNFSALEGLVSYKPVYYKKNVYESQKLGPTARANFDLSGLLSLGRAYAPIVNKINGYETFAGQNGAKEHGQFFCFLRKLGPEPKPNFLLF